MQQRKRSRSSRGCRPCKQRKVKCDETPDSCHNCTRLGFDCVYEGAQAASAVPSPSPSQASSPATIQRRTQQPPAPLPKRRTRQACSLCRANKLRCSGNVPRCDRCRSQGLRCVYEKSVPPPPTAAEDATTSTVAAASTAAASHSVTTPTPPPPATTTTTTTINSLDPRRAILQIHIDAFFHHVHTAAAFSFIHKGSFLRSWHTGAMARDLVRAVTGVASRFVVAAHEPTTTTTTTTKAAKKTDRPGAPWLEELEAALFRDMETVSIPRLQIMLLLVFDRVAAGRLMAAWHMLSLACRHAFALRLHEPTDAVLFTNQECRRRLVWCVFCLDRTLRGGDGGGGGADVQCPRDMVRVTLPCDNRLFSLEQETCTESLGDMAAAATAGRLKHADRLGVTAYLVRVLDLRDEMHASVTSGGGSRDGPLSLLTSTVSRIRQQLATFEALLPPEMRATERALYLRVSTPDVGVYVMVHSWLHTAACEMYLHLIEQQEEEDDGEEEGYDAQGYWHDLQRHAGALSDFWCSLHSVQRFSERFFSTDVTGIGHCVYVNTRSHLILGRRRRENGDSHNADDAGVGTNSDDTMSKAKATLSLNLEILSPLARVSPFIRSYLQQTLADIEAAGSTYASVVDEFKLSHKDLLETDPTAERIPLYLEDIALAARRREDARFPNPKRRRRGRSPTEADKHQNIRSSEGDTHSYGTSRRRLAAEPCNTTALADDASWTATAGTSHINQAAADSPPSLDWDGGGGILAGTDAQQQQQQHHHHHHHHAGPLELDYLSPALSGFAAQNLYGGAAEAGTTISGLFASHGSGDGGGGGNDHGEGGAGVVDPLLQCYYDTSTGHLVPRITTAEDVGAGGLW